MKQGPELDTKDTISKITLLGEEHTVTLPAYAEREELHHARIALTQRKGIAVWRVVAAAIGLCTRIGRERHANVSFADCRFDVLEYGGKVLSYLREKGVSHDEILAVGVPILDAIQANLFPREAEVEAARGN